MSEKKYLELKTQFDNGEIPLSVFIVDALQLGYGMRAQTHAEKRTQLVIGGVSGGVTDEEKAAITEAQQCLTPLATQEGGSHYKDLKIQPIEYIHANGIPFAEGNVIKYVTRWRSKNGIADLKKARHFIDLLIQLETEASHD